jgi:protein-tyrosine phosphatase
LYWIPEAWPGRIAIMPRPRGGDWLEDEMRAWRGAGVDIVVSLLEPEEVQALDLASEERLARANRIEFVSFPIADRGIPQAHDAVSELVLQLAASIRAGKNVAVHCRQGIGRAALVAVAVLIQLGMNVETAIGLVGTARGLPVPETPEQRQWLLENSQQSTKPIPA